MRRLLTIALCLWAAVACDDEQEGYVEGYQTGRADGTQLGFDEGRQAGYKTGLEQGRKKGHREGLAVGRADAIGRWAPLGFGLGALVGMGLVTIITRRQLRGALERRRIGQRLAQHRARVPDALDPALIKQLDGALSRIAELEQPLGAEATAPLVRAAVDLHTLLHRLRTAQAAVPATDPRRLRSLEAQLEDADETTRPALQDAITALRRKGEARARTTQHAQRCELELEALDNVLDHLRLGVANIDAAGREALVAQLGGEVAEATDQLERAVATAAQELAGV